MKRKLAGFTLIEMLLYGSLLSIFLLVLTQIFTSSLESQLETQASSTLEQDTRFIFERLAYNLENSDSVSLPATPGDTSTNLTLTHSGQSLSYSLQGNSLVITDSEGVHALNSYATDVTNISFQRLGNPGGKPNIKTSFTLRSQTLVNGQEAVKTFEATLGTR